MIFYKSDNDDYPYTCRWCHGKAEGYVMSRDVSWNTCVPCLLEQAPIIRMTELLGV